MAPGTAGSAVGLLIVVAVRAAGSGWLEAGVLVAACLLGVWASSRAELHFGRKDPGQIVIDEVAGMLVTLAFVPTGTVGLLLGFVLFRLFDIVKPFPARLVERWPRGLGIMADDVVAGCYAHAALRVVAWMAPAWVLT